VQKLSYHHAQLQGDAKWVIAEFQLTNTNYEYSVTQLREWFGQPYKQIDPHIQALIDLTSPVSHFPAYMNFM